MRLAIAILSLFTILALAWAAWQLHSRRSQDSQAQAMADPDEAVAVAEPGVVGLWAPKTEAGDTAANMGLIGCGVVVDSRGYVLTSAALPVTMKSLHAIDRAHEKYETAIVAMDKDSGLSLLKLDPGKVVQDREFETVRFADSDCITEGDPLLALGGREDPARWELTSKSARILSRRQSLLIDEVKYRSLIQLEATLTPENIGGPLIDSRGSVVGFCLPFVRPPNSHPSVAYGLPANRAKGFLARLPIPHWSDGPSGRVNTWLGAEMVPLDASFVAQSSGPDDGGGARIVNFVKNNSPAEHAGLRRGDVITHVDNSRMIDDTQFDGMVPQWCVSDNIQLTVLRDGQKKDISVQWDKPVYELPRAGSLAEVVLVVLVLTLMYYLVYRDILNRVVLFVLGAVVMAIVGHYLGFYDEERIASALLTKLDVMCFIVGMQLITGVLANAGGLEYLGRKIALATGGNRWRIMLLFCVITYVFSLVVNNLTTIMIMAPMVLRLSEYLDFDPKPFLVSMVIASNLGGASTMVGDFPNMIIGAEAGLSFWQFAVYMLPICLLELCVVLLYIRIAQHSLFGSTRAATKQKAQSRPVPGEYTDCTAWIDDLPELTEHRGDTTVNNAVFRELQSSLARTIKNPRALKRGLIILGLVVAGFLFAGFLNLSPALVALTGGIAALAFGGCDPLDLLQKVSIRDILFFSGLFVVVGAAEASGALSYVSEGLVHLSFGNLLVLSLLLMWVGAFATCFLNAGPTTAMFLPVVLSLETAAPHSLYWWALSLGVCAGSSGTLAGATAGSVTASMVDRFIDDDNDRATATTGPGHGENQALTSLTFGEYATLGVPIMLILLVMSSIYVAVMFQW
ncbi:SLC13 family permease [Verrucomicrobiota bacterium]